mgnify:CR=1 FL=1
MKKALFILAACMIATFGANAQNLTGREIIQKVKDRPDGDTRYGEMELTLIKKNGSSRQRKVSSWAMDVFFFFFRRERNRLPDMGLRPDWQRGCKMAISSCHEEDSPHQWIIVKNRLFYGYRLHLRRHGIPSYR